MIARTTCAFRRSAIGGVAAALAIAAIVLVPRPADANPALARATGHTCAVCHVPAQEPLLNPTGQEFKSCGFSFCKGPPDIAAQPRPQPPPQPDVAPTDNEGIEETTVLGHNGSTIEMTRKGNRLTMRYAGVRAGLSAREGEILFRGTISDNNRIQGTAYTFKRGCQPAGYAVSGVQTHNKIVLRGDAPVRDQSGCEVVDYDPSAPSATLQFDIAE